MVDMMVVIASAEWVRARPRTRMRAQRISWARLTPSSGRIAIAWQRGLVIMHSLVALFLGVITLAIILLVIELVALQALVVTLTTIMASIVFMMIVRSAIVAIALVTLMVFAIFVTVMLMVAGFTATHGRKMSHFLFLQLILILGNLLKNARWLVGCLTLLKEGDELDQVSRHNLIQVRELVLVCLRLRKEDLFILLLCRGHFHHLTEVATLEIAEELYLTPHELIHWHEGGLLGSTKPADPLVASVRESGNGLKVVPDTIVKACLHTICIDGHCIAMMLVHLVRPMSWKHWPWG
jgi:hypothetical protein